MSSWWGGCHAFKSWLHLVIFTCRIRVSIFIEKHEAGSTLRRFYFRKGDNGFLQVTGKQNTVQRKTIEGTMPGK